MYELNATIYNLASQGRLDVADGSLVSPANSAEVFERLALGYTVDEDGFLVAPDETKTEVQAQTVENALDWDIAMVVVEQEAVRSLSQEYRARVGELIYAFNMRGVDFLLNMHDSAGLDSAVAVAIVDYSAIAWAEKAFTASSVAALHVGFELDITFQSTEHRIALGIAMVFQEHGLTEAEYLAYMESVGRVSSVEDVVPYNTTEPARRYPLGDASEERAS